MYRHYPLSFAYPSLYYFTLDFTCGNNGIAVDVTGSRARVAASQSRSPTLNAPFEK